MAKKLDHGLDLDAALSRWGDKELLGQMQAMIGTDELLSVLQFERKFGDEPTRRAYQRLREKFEEDFQAKLRDGILFCSGIADGAEKREVVHFTLWDVASIDYDLWDVVIGNRTYQAIEFFDSSAVPRNVTVDGWLANVFESSAGFSHDARFNHCRLGPHDAHFNAAQAEIIRRLFDVSATPHPYLYGKDLKGSAESVGAVFRRHPNWQKFVEKQGQKYRLRTDAAASMDRARPVSKKPSKTS